jgi:ferredoxin-NADP reductase
MLSIINSLAVESGERECVLLHGVRNSHDHPFREHLDGLVARFANLHAVYCYSQPQPEEIAGRDYHVRGHVDVKLIQQVLPHPGHDFYLCGPPPFMQSLYQGLTQWGVPAERIRCESFGSASLPAVQSQRQPDTGGVSVTFRQSGRQAMWTGEHANLLDLMEAEGIAVDSGCRAGNCGTCQTRLLDGRVVYDHESHVECDAGHCLPCLAKPAEAIEIDA